MQVEHLLICEFTNFATLFSIFVALVANVFFSCIFLSLKDFSKIGYISKIVFHSFG